MPTARLAGIYRNPIKGFRLQKLPQAQIVQSRGIVFDRIYGVVDGRLPANADGRWLRCKTFARQSRDRRPLDLDIVYPGPQTTALMFHNGQVFSFDFSNPDQLETVCDTLRGWFPQMPDIRMIKAAGGYWDFDDSAISIISASTVRELSSAAGHHIDPARFRANLVVDDVPAWSEQGWIGRRIQIGSVTLEIIRPQKRCTAPSFDFETREADLNVPVLMWRRAGHLFCGVYARVICGGIIETGAAIELGEPVADRSLRPVFGASIPPAPPFREWPRRYVVDRIDQVSNSVKSFWLRPELGDFAGDDPIQPGQHIRIHITGDLDWRCYTVSGFGDNGELRISVKREDEGAVSRHLHDALEVGSGVLISGPFGKFVLPSNIDAPLVFATAGIGITPVLAMLCHLASNKHSGAVSVIHVARSESEAIHWDEVMKAASQLSCCEVQLHLTRSSKDGGMISKSGPGHRPNASALLSGLPDEAQLYLCGPEGFVTDLEAAADNAGIERANRHAEVFVSPRSVDPLLPFDPPEPGPFRVEFSRSGKTFEWKSSNGTILDMADEMGFMLPYQCRAGLCSTCAQRLSVGTVAHNQAARARHDEGEALLCACVPTSDVVIDA